MLYLILSIEALVLTHVLYGFVIVFVYLEIEAVIWWMVCE